MCQSRSFCCLGFWLERSEVAPDTCADYDLVSDDNRPRCVSLLGGVFTLHDPRCFGRCGTGCVGDVERLCGAVLERRGISLDQAAYEDRLAYLIGEAWIIAPKYDPARDRGRKSAMSSWLFLRLGQRLVDADRAEYRTRWVTKNGYVYERARPQFVGLEDSGVERALGGSPLDGPEHRSADLNRLLRERDSEGSWPDSDGRSRRSRRAA